jgi:hypothetical protein
MKRSVVISMLAALVIVVVAAGCGGSKYSDAKELNMKYVAMMKDYVDDLDKAGSASDVADAINRFADSMEKIWPKMKDLSEKYPELKDHNNPPDELKESQKEAEEMGKKMMATMMKIMPYMDDPEVQKAQERLGKVMSMK